MIERFKATLLLAPLPLAIAMALNPAQAMAGEFADLCGETIMEDTKLEGITDTVTEYCIIQVAGDYSLTILDSNITLDHTLHMDGADMAMLTIKESIFNSQNGDIYIRFEDGKVTIKDDSEFYMMGNWYDYFNVRTDSGDITFRDNLVEFGYQTEYHYRSFFLNTRSGKVDVLKNELIFSEAAFGASGWGEEAIINVKDNFAPVCTNFRSANFSLGYGRLSIVDNVFPHITHSFHVGADGGDIHIVGNEMNEIGSTIGDHFDVWSDGGDVIVVGNVLDVEGDVRIKSSCADPWCPPTGGDIKVTKNDFGSPGFTYVNSYGGMCIANKNDPDLLCEP
jgi:hypothetical protein